MKRRKLLLVIPIILIVGCANTASAYSPSPPFSKFFEDFYPGQEDMWHYINCYPTDTSVTYADMFLAANVAYRSSIELAVGVEVTFSSTAIRRIAADFRITGYLLGLTLFSTNSIDVRVAFFKWTWHIFWWSWDLVGDWSAYNYVINGFGSKSWSYASFHYSSPYISTAPGDYRLAVSVYIDSFWGNFGHSSGSLSSPGQVYFDSISYQVGH